MTHNESLPTHLLLSVSSLLLNPPRPPQPKSNGCISERRGRSFDLFFSVIPSFQIKGWFAFQLTKSSGGPRQRANIVKCLSRSICVMARLSIIGTCTLVLLQCTQHHALFCSCHHGTILFPALLSVFHYCPPLFMTSGPSKITGWSCGFTATSSPCTRLCSPHITMETTRFLSPRGSIKHFYFEKLFMKRVTVTSLRCRRLKPSYASFQMLLKDQ